jgi:hypothetical protein
VNLAKYQFSKNAIPTKTRLGIKDIPFANDESEWTGNKLSLNRLQIISPKLNAAKTLTVLRNGLSHLSA